MKSGDGPSSNVSATAFGVEDGPDGVKTQDATTPDNDPFVTSMVPAVVVSVHCGSSGVPGGTAELALLVEDILEIAVQVNGKLRDVIHVPAAASQADLEKAARSAEKVKSFLDGKAIKKIIIVPKKLVNIVVG